MPTSYPKTQFNPPETLVRSSHSLTILVRGKAIGLINGWSPQQNRQMSPIYELNSETSGLILEQIPGNMQNQQVTIQRYDIWPTKMEEAFGTVELTMLSNQQSPFSVQERWVSPTGGLEVWQYSGCWFNNIGRTYRSDDTRIVNVSATLVYTLKSKIQGL
jgi:hypothetical protein